MTCYQPNHGERYWCIRGIRPWVASHVWEGDRLDQLLRDTGRTFKTEGEAQAALRLDGSDERTPCCCRPHLSGAPMTDELPKLPRAAYNLDLQDGFPTVAYSAQQMYDFARSYGKEAVTLERERCAQLCQDRAGTVSMFATSSDALAHNNAVFDCAAAIRARSEHGREG